MSKYSGYMDKVALFDLSTGKLEDYPWSDKDRELYIGGKIMAAKVLYDNLTGKEEALSAENIIVISTGPLTGTGAPSSTRFSISAISPVTGSVASANCGGNFGYRLKKAGYDALILKGKCSGHSWLEIYNDSFVLHDADSEGVWGQRTSEAQQSVHDILDRDNGCRVRCGVMTIGPAGENLVPFADIFNQERTGGKIGLGAVFGAKNLKAIAVSGNHAVTVANEKKNQAWNKKWVQYLKDHPFTGAKLPDLGISGLLGNIQPTGLLAAKCGEVEKHGAADLADSLEVASKGCLSCPVKCARTVEVNGTCAKASELDALGYLAGGDMRSAAKWNAELCELGMDVLSAVDAAVCGNNVGNTDKVSALWEELAYRRTDICCACSGGDCGDTTVPAVAAPTAALERYLGVNLEGFAAKAKADLTMLIENISEMISATGQCTFTGYAMLPAKFAADPAAAGKLIGQLSSLLKFINKSPELLFFPMASFYQDRAMKNAVGMKMTVGKYIRCGERGCTLKRSVDALFGVAENAEDDMNKAYFAARGWDKTGVPTDKIKAKLKIKKGAS